MSATLTVAVDVGPFERAPADLAIATFFENDRPLRGEAGSADWRLCGLLSELVAETHLRGRAGEVALVHTLGRLRAPRLLLIGLGRPAELSPLRVRDCVRDAVDRAMRLGAGSVALPMPGHWSGLLAVGPAAAATLRGAAGVVAEHGRPLRIRLLVPAGSASKALAGLETAADQLGGPGAGIRITAEEAVAFAPTAGREAGEDDPGGARQVRRAPTDP